MNHCDPHLTQSSSGIAVEKTVDIGGLHTYLQIEGPEDGFPLVLIHGFMTSSFTWREVKRILADHYRVYTLDLPGHGRSDHRRYSYSVDFYSEFFSQFLQTVGIDKAIIGGITRQYFPKAGFYRRWRASYSQKDAANDQVISEYFSNFRRFGNKEIRLGLQVRASYGHRFERFRSAMKSIKTPTLLIFGENDPIVPLSTAYQFRDSIQNSKLVTIPNCGDFPQEEHPDIVSKNILAFLSDLI